ncbi:response regulator [Desulfovibrio aminophilus]|nr:response regulator [Desulfovibrio aminophilus]MCM0755741.1 response regulator [Desulfovibrio aminophilus]
MSPDHPLTVLVVEDNPVNREVVVCFLADLGHAARTAANGVEALAALAENPCDIVLMDLEMPVMDGFETTRRIRLGEAGETVRGVPIVAVTAHSLPEFRRRCQETGMDAFTAKPVRLETLMETIQGLCPDFFERPVLDERRGLINLNGKRELFERICATFLDDIPPRRLALIQGRDAGDNEALAHQAHSLKGSAGLVGALGLQEAARALEACARDGGEVGRCLDGLLLSLDSLERALRSRREGPLSGPGSGCAETRSG